MIRSLWLGVATHAWTYPECFKITNCLYSNCLKSLERVEDCLDCLHIARHRWKLNCYFVGFDQTCLGKSKVAV